MSTARTLPAARTATRAAWASAVGTMLEWYDFGIYGVVAALVLNQAFFPTLDPAVATIVSFSTLTVGFVARPVGAIVFGHIGDRWGRRSTLILTLVITGAVTILIGLLPTYADIGIAAPIILVALRFLQGVGLGGEWGGAVLLSTEHAPADRRSYYGGIMAMGVPLGVLLSNAVFLIITLAVPFDQFQAWGWRIPFLGSILILAVGLWIRIRVPESPQFAELKAETTPGSRARLPLRDIFTIQPGRTLLSVLVIVGSSAVAYVYLSFILSWGQGAVGYPAPVILGAICVGAVIWAAAAPYFASRGDRVGGMRGLFLGWGLVRTVAVIPFFLLVSTGNVVLLYIAMGLMGGVISATQVPAGAAIASLFPVRVRYTGTSFAYQVGSILGGGITPLVAAAIIATAAGLAGVIGYVVLISLISCAAGFLFRRDALNTPKSSSEEAGVVSESVRAD